METERMRVLVKDLAKVCADGFGTEVRSQWPGSFAEIVEEFEAALASSEGPDNEIMLRRGLWASHGHAGIYGDDGEMQCGECGIDYKRDSVESIIAKRTENGLRKLAAPTFEEPLREAVTAGMVDAALLAWYNPQRPIGTMSRSEFIAAHLSAAAPPPTASFRTRVEQAADEIADKLCGGSDGAQQMIAGILLSTLSEAEPQPGQKL